MNQNTELSDRELSEKVAGKLGWILMEGKGWVDKSRLCCADAKLVDVIFGEKGFLGMKNDASRKRWSLEGWPDDNYFLNRNRSDMAFYPQTEEDIFDAMKPFMERTGKFKSARHGLFRSCALAFIQIPEN